MSQPDSNPIVLHDRLPLLPLKDVVLFPRMVVPLMIGRPGSLAAVEEALTSGRPLFLVTQKDASVEDPGRDDLHAVGVAANPLQSLRLPDGSMKVVVEALARGRLENVRTRGDYLEAVAVRIEDTAAAPEQEQAASRMVIRLFEDYVRLSQRIAPEIVAAIRDVNDGGALADLVCAHLSLRIEERQELLESLDVVERLERLSGALMRENEMLEMERKVRDRVRDQMERGQREYYLQEQLKAIHQELGTRGESDEITELTEMIQAAKMPKEVHEKAIRELGRYERMPPMSPESAVLRTYIEWLAEMPWDKRSKDSIHLKKAQKVLDEDHYGLEKVKERILEFLAVRKLSKSTKGPILCLVGPPGVGKTSLGESIARAMGRKFVRLSLGGVHDEAEIRGHRRTYVGSLPGRIAQSLRKVGVKNPVFMLDEVDKLGNDFRGDPASALLEVLDPKQNHAFSDHYLEVDLDLHEVFFIATANNEYDIPHALHDRLEIVPLSGYAPIEKRQIAKLFLVPTAMREAGLSADQIEISDDAIDGIISRYTREAGVRELERQVASVCRKVARKVVSHKKAPKTVVKRESLTEMLGPPEYLDTQLDTTPSPGLAVGLAWTPTGGDILNIETTVSRGKGNLTLTGHLGEVMQESAQAAFTYLRANAKALEIPLQFHKTMDIHVHVPEGGIPKDGPSAGIAIAISIMSALRRQAPLARVAMTGEITLRGRVLPVGGIKEKLLAAHRAGVQTVLMPKENEKDLRELPKEVMNELAVQCIGEMHEAIPLVLPAKPKRAAKAS